MIDCGRHYWQPKGDEAPQIVATLLRSRRFVQQWAYAYREGGIEAIQAGKSSGRPTTLPREKEAALKQRMFGGPTDADEGVCMLRGLDAMRILCQ